VNVTGIELAPTPLSKPSRTLVGGIPGLRLPGSELGAFLSLVTGFAVKISATAVTGFAEKVPATAQMYTAPAFPSHSAGIGAPRKDKGSNSTRGLKDLSALAKSNSLLSKDKKKNEQADSVVLPRPVAPPQGPAVLIASPATVYEVPSRGPQLRVESDQVTSSGNKGDSGATSDAERVPLASASAPVTMLGVGVAFALRLIPVVSEAKDSSQADMSSLQSVAAKFTSIPTPEPVQLNLNQSSTITNEVSGATLTTLKGSFSNLVPFRASPDAKPLQSDEHVTSISTAVRPGLDRQAEPAPGPMPVPSPAAVPQNTQQAATWSWPSLPNQSAESNAAAPPESHARPDQQLKSEPSTLAAPGSTDSVTRQPDLAATANGTLPVMARTSPRPIAPGESGVSQPEPKESKAEPAAKRELQPSSRNSRQTGANATGAEAPSRPPDTLGPPVTRVDRSSAREPSALKVASEPETKVGIAPPPFRQISLKLTTDDSTRVSLDLIEKAGKVQITVRTPDHELAKSLQTDLGDLIGRLEGKGFKIESWIPATVHQAAAPSPSSDSNNGFGQPRHSGAGQGGQQRHQQNGSNQRQQARWTAQIEETLSADEARSES
jgi:hypothetical protein